MQSSFPSLRQRPLVTLHRYRSLGRDVAAHAVKTLPDLAPGEMTASPASAASRQVRPDTDSLAIGAPGGLSVPQPSLPTPSACCRR